MYFKFICPAAPCAAAPCALRPWLAALSPCTTLQVSAHNTHNTQCTHNARTHTHTHTQQHTTTHNTHTTAWNMLSGARRLGERAARVGPSSMANAGMMMAQDAARAAAETGDARGAAGIGREAAVASAVAHHLDSEFHLNVGEAIEGSYAPMARLRGDGLPPPGTNW